MAYPALRSMNAELNEGATEGTYKRVINNRGGVVEGLTEATRRDLSDVYFGIHESDSKLRPDGKRVHTPYYESTPPVHVSGLIG